MNIHPVDYLVHFLKRSAARVIFRPGYLVVALVCPRDFVSLLMAGEWKTAAAGEAVLAEGKPVSSICVAISGNSQVHKDGKDGMPLKPGHVIGTAFALTGQPSPIAVIFTEPARYFCWPRGNIRAFLDKRPDLRLTLQSLVNRDLAVKLDELSTDLLERL
jgi:CRP-like cAMP-binding protein